MSNRQFLDAHEYASRDFSAVTRARQNNVTQRWILTPLGDDTYTIQQKSGGRFLDAHETADKDYSAVTRPAQDDDTPALERQGWEHRHSLSATVLYR